MWVSVSVLRPSHWQSHVLYLLTPNAKQNRMWARAYLLAHTFNRIDDYIFANDTIQLRCLPPRPTKMRSFPISRVCACVFVNPIADGERLPHNNSHIRISFSSANKTHTRTHKRTHAWARKQQTCTHAVSQCLTRTIARLHFDRNIRIRNVKKSKIWENGVQCVCHDETMEQHGRSERKRSVKTEEFLT